MKYLMRETGFTVILLTLLLQNPFSQNVPVKNIILMIGDGMGVEQVYSAISVSKDKLNIENAKYIGFSKTYSADNYITDSGAGGTSISSGNKTKNKYVGVDTNGRALKSILMYAAENNKSTGIVTTCDITHATPASFYAHNTNRYNEDEIAMDLLKANIDLIIAGGWHRLDSLGILDSLEKKDVYVTKKLDRVRVKSTQPTVCFVAPEHPKSILEGRDFNYLETAVEKATSKLNQNSAGFFLMVEASQIDWGGHSNNLEYIVTELLDFDKAIGKAFEFADNNPGTLVIITADHETGGLSLLDGNIKTRNIQGKFNTTNHSGVMVPIYAYGDGAQYFSQIMENTDIFNKMMDAFGFYGDK